MTTDQDLRTVALSARSHEVLLQVLDAFDFEDSCLAAHGHTGEEAAEVMSLARGDWAPYSGRWNSDPNAVGLELTAYQVEVLHCVVCSVEPYGSGLDADPQEIIDMESSIGNIKILDGYTPTYYRSTDGPSLTQRLLDEEDPLLTPEEERDFRSTLEGRLQEFSNEAVEPSGEQAEGVSIDMNDHLRPGIIRDVVADLIRKESDSSAAMSYLEERREEIESAVSESFSPGEIRQVMIRAMIKAEREFINATAKSIVWAFEKEFEDQGRSVRRP